MLEETVPALSPAQICSPGWCRRSSLLLLKPAAPFSPFPALGPQLQAQLQSFKASLVLASHFCGET